jgi:hypothetical protein
VVIDVEALAWQSVELTSTPYGPPPTIDYIAGAELVEPGGERVRIEGPRLSAFVPFAEGWLTRTLEPNRLTWHRPDGSVGGLLDEGSAGGTIPHETAASPSPARAAESCKSVLASRP